MITVKTSPDKTQEIVYDAYIASITNINDDSSLKPLESKDFKSKAWTATPQQKRRLYRLMRKLRLFTKK